MAERERNGQLLFEESDWTFDVLRRTHDALERLATDDLGLDVYPNQIEIISTEQMLDAYSSIGMPVMYRHWSFGKHFIQHERLYRTGARGLAFEIVINSNPCICYCLEENSMPLQALVMAHAAFGHNHFFKSNHLFQQWTDPDGILDYLEYARSFVAKCEERHGRREVEQLIDSAHALMPNGVFRHHRPPSLSQREQERDARRRLRDQEKAADYLLDTLVPSEGSAAADAADETRRKMKLPEENLLYFLERFSPILQPWQREVLRIIGSLAQYYYPQKQTQVMNEGCACFVHFECMRRLHDAGRISDGAMLEILHHHSNVLAQTDFDQPGFGGINPYALGFAMMQDIQRICEEPTEEDRAWFPQIAGAGDWRNVLKDVWRNYRDESFIQQFLSPHVMRKFRLFALTDNSEENWYTVSNIHDERGYRGLRDALSRSRDISMSEPEILVSHVDLPGDRVLHLQHVVRNEIPIDQAQRRAMLEHLQRLWGYRVVLEDIH